MLFLLALATLAIWGIVATVLALRSDGYAPRPTDRARVPDRDDARAHTPGIAPRQG